MQLWLFPTPRQLVLSTDHFALVFRPPPPSEPASPDVVVEFLPLPELDFSGAILVNSRVAGCLGVLRVGDGESNSALTPSGALHHRALAADRRARSSPRRLGEQIRFCLSSPPPSSSRPTRPSSALASSPSRASSRSSSTASPPQPTTPSPPTRTPPPSTPSPPSRTTMTSSARAGTSPAPTPTSSNTPVPGSARSSPAGPSTSAETPERPQSATTRSISPVASKPASRGPLPPRRPAPPRTRRTTPSRGRTRAMHGKRSIRGSSGTPTSSPRSSPSAARYPRPYERSWTARRSS